MRRSATWAIWITGLPGSGKSVLARGAAEVLHDLLETMGYSVCGLASTGQEAVDLAGDDHRIDDVADIVDGGEADDLGLPAAERLDVGDLPAAPQERDQQRAQQHGCAYADPV